MKKILFIYRSPEKGGNSIEEIYRVVAKELSFHFSIDSYIWNRELSFYRNLRKIKDAKADIFHITGDINYLVLFLPWKRTSLTIHDLGRFKELRRARKIIFSLIWVYIPLFLAKKVVTVSNYTKEDLLRFLPYTRNKLEVIHNPVSPIFYQNCTSKSEEDEKKIILQIGTGVNKNLETLVKSSRGENWRLCIIGRLNESQEKLLSSYEIDFENFIGLSHQGVFNKYCEADVVVFNSLHEGFGMPIIEAQAVGRPIIISKVCSLPEVAQNTAHYIDNPLDDLELKNAIKLIIEKPNYRKKLVEDGIVNVKRFRLSVIIQKYITLFNQMSFE